MRYVPGSRVKSPTSSGSVSVKVEFSLSLCAYAGGSQGEPQERGERAQGQEGRQLLHLYLSFSLANVESTGDSRHDERLLLMAWTSLSLPSAIPLP